MLRKHSGGTFALHKALAVSRSYVGVLGVGRYANNQ